MNSSSYKQTIGRRDARIVGNRGTSDWILCVDENVGSVTHTELVVNSAVSTKRVVVLQVEHIVGRYKIL